MDRPLMVAGSRPDPKKGGTASLLTEMSVAWVYDMDACRGPTGVTRHALAQLERLRERPGIDLRVISGRMTEPDGLAYWEALGDTPRREMFLSTRNVLRWWRVWPHPKVDRWAGRVDWVYCPAEYFVPTSRARRAVTSHDVLQNLDYATGSWTSRNREWLRKVFGRADLILSVSRFNTDQLLHHYPENDGRVAYVPNAAEDLFFEPATGRERAQIRADLGLPPGLPYLLSVANFQARKNLPRLIRAVGRVPEVARGELALVLLGAGAPGEERLLREEIERLGPKVVARLPGYRQGPPLRAAYAEAAALVFPSLCESFGIPVVEAMAQGIPVVLSGTTALPEIGGRAGWYFDPNREDAIAGAITDMLSRHDERARKIAMGHGQAVQFRWKTANDCLVAALQDYRTRSRR